MSSRSSSNRRLSACLLVCFLSICEPKTKSAPPARSSKTSNDGFSTYSDTELFRAGKSKRSTQFGIRMEQTEQLRGPSNQFGIQMDQTGQLHGPANQFGIQMDQTERLHGPSSSLHCSSEKSARFDCHPDPGANPSRCAARGCCWHRRTVSKPTKKQRINIPYCFFPTNYNGYILDETRDTDTGFTSRVLRPRSSRSGWPDDVFELKLEVVYETQTRLHFKVTL